MALILPTAAKSVSRWTNFSAVDRISGAHTKYGQANYDRHKMRARFDPGGLGFEMPGVAALWLASLYGVQAYSAYCMSSVDPVVHLHQSSSVPVELT